VAEHDEEHQYAFRVIEIIIPLTHSAFLLSYYTPIRIILLLF
jgi:hypothetical protein